MFNKTINNYINNINNDDMLLAIGKILSNQQLLVNSSNLQDYEFKIFSQFGDDGIIQYLVRNVNIQNKTFIEFGVENYLESNTRFLLMNNNWSGYVMDGSEECMQVLKNQSWYWKYDLRCKSIFIDKDNVDGLINNIGFENIGLLHIDLDGNDYWILKSINLSKLNPSILIMEYNSVFGKDRAITVPYDKNFNRTEKHYSNLYWGSSLMALNILANDKGYSLIGSNSAGNNAYFLRNDLINDKIKKSSVDDIYVESKYRESRNDDYTLSYLRDKERISIIKDLEVVNIINNKLEKI